MNRRSTHGDDSAGIQEDQAVMFLLHERLGAVAAGGGVALATLALTDSVPSCENRSRIELLAIC